MDRNQEGIVAALRAAGATVQPLSNLGAGVPDLLVGYRYTTFLLEVKDANGKVSRVQNGWYKRWNGRPVVVVRSEEEALIAIGAR